MKRKIILRLCLLTVFLALLWSCRNEDFASGETKPQRNNVNFFLHSERGGAAARSGVDYVMILKAYNYEKDFLATMPDQQGMPIWDKMQVLDNGEKTILYVPLSADKAGLSSLLIVNIDEENTVARLQNFTNDYLEAYIYNADNPAAKRKLLMDTFLQMDFFTFGHQEFTNLPKDIYKGSTEYNRLNIPDVKIEAEQSKGFIYNTICTTYHFCVHGHSTSSCDYGSCTCGGLISCFLATSCTTTATWVDDSPFPSFPGSHGGGGGGGTPGPQPPIDPCVMKTVFYRIKPGCLGNAGDPGIDGLDDPCEKIKNKFSETKFKEKVAAIDKVEVFDYDHEMGFAAGYPPTNTGVTGTQYPPMENVIGSHSVRLPDGNQYFGFMHSHNNKEGAVKIFSPYDLATFLTSCVSNADTSGSIRDAYAMVITSAGNYILQYTGFSSSFGTGPNTIKFWNVWYERELKAIQNDDNSFDQDKLEKVFLRFLKEKVKIDGVKLYKVEKLTGKAKELTLDINNNVIPVECK